MKSARILMADDEAFFLELFRDIFEHAGFEVAIAYDGDEARKVAVGFKPEVIVLDVGMPPGENGGYATLSEFRQDPATADVPVIMLSNLGDSQEIRKGYDLGVITYRLKPPPADLELLKITQQIPDLLEPLWRLALQYRLRKHCLAAFTIEIPSMSQTFPRYAYQNLQAGTGPLWKSATSSPDIGKWYEEMIFVADAIETLHMQWLQAKRIRGKRTQEFAAKRDAWRSQVKSKGRQLFNDLFEQNGRLLAQWKNAERDVSSLHQLSLRLTGGRESLTLPFEGLEDLTSPLAFRFPMSRQLNHYDGFHLPSWRAFLTQKPCPPLQALVIAGSEHALEEAQAVSSKLIEVAEQIDARVDIYPPDLTQPLTAQEAITWLEKRRYHVIHYAGHAVFDRQSPENSYLGFGADDTEYDRIKATKLYDLLCKSDTQFLFLSCCSGAEIGDMIHLKDNSVLGLLDAAIQAGVPSLIGYRWPVTHRSALEFASHFYDGLFYYPSSFEHAAWYARKKIFEANGWDETWFSPMLIVQNPD